MAEKISVLIIDDDADLRDLIEQGLQMAGFAVYQAGDGPTGIETAKERAPTLILLDVTMEGMNGLETLSKLKSIDQTREIPVFMLTGKSGTDDIKRALAAGAAGYLTKPVEIMKLGPMLREKLSKCEKRPVRGRC